MSQALELIAALLGIFALAPAATLWATGSWSKAGEALRGYALVIGLLIGLPMVLGVIAAIVGLAFTS